MIILPLFHQSTIHLSIIADFSSFSTLKQSYLRLPRSNGMKALWQKQLLFASESENRYFKTSPQHDINILLRLG